MSQQVLFDPSGDTAAEKWQRLKRCRPALRGLELRARSMSPTLADWRPWAGLCRELEEHAGWFAEKPGFRSAAWWKVAYDALLEAYWTLPPRPSLPDWWTADKQWNTASVEVS